jgi:serine/threonine protein kinase
LGKHEVVKRIAKKESHELFLARQDEQFCVLKTWQPQTPDDFPNTNERNAHNSELFQQVSDIADYFAEIGPHDNLLPHLGFDIDQDCNLYLKFAYCSGGNLADYLKQKLSNTTRLEILLQTLKPLRSLHARGWAHNNLKLQNVLVETGSAGRFCGVKLSDMRRNGSGDLAAFYQICRVMLLGSETELAEEYDDPTDRVLFHLITT